MNQRPRMLGRLLLALTVMATLGACAAGLPEPTNSDASRAATRWPGVTVADLSRGREVYVGTCAGCHALKSPDAVPAAQWSTEVNEMRTKRGVKMSDHDAALLVEYLWTASTRMQSDASGAESARR